MSKSPSQVKSTQSLVLNAIKNKKTTTEDKIKPNDAAPEKNNEEVIAHKNCRSVNPIQLIKVEKNRSKEKPPEVFERPYIAPENLPWSVQYYEYYPVEFTSDKNLNIYDTEDHTLHKAYFNKFDESAKIDRRSGHGNYEFDITGRPLNVMGRTGISGRGHLGRWGPNYAADPIVTRWKMENGVIQKDPGTGKPILEFVAIARKDTGDWAIPGGMVDKGEKITETLRREFLEESTDSLGADSEELKKIENILGDFFKGGVKIYHGYVDDPRNTDNAWMETYAYNFHDENRIFDKIKLKAGDDAKKSKWMEINGNIKLYASHKDFIKKTVELHKAHW